MTTKIEDGKRLLALGASTILHSPGVRALFESTKARFLIRRYLGKSQELGHLRDWTVFRGSEGICVWRSLGGDYVYAFTVRSVAEHHYRYGKIQNCVLSTPSLTLNAQGLPGSWNKITWTTDRLLIRHNERILIILLPYCDLAVGTLCRHLRCRFQSILNLRTRPTCLT